MFIQLIVEANNNNNKFERFYINFNVMLLTFDLKKKYNACQKLEYSLTVNFEHLNVFKCEWRDERRKNL